MSVFRFGGACARHDGRHRRVRTETGWRFSGMMTTCTRAARTPAVSGNAVRGIVGWGFPGRNEAQQTMAGNACIPPASSSPGNTPLRRCVCVPAGVR